MRIRRTRVGGHVDTALKNGTTTDELNVISSILYKAVGQTRAFSTFATGRASFSLPTACHLPPVRCVLITTGGLFLLPSLFPPNGHIGNIGISILVVSREALTN